MNIPQPDATVIAIYHSDKLFETRACPIIQDPDGGRAAVWRGLAYPIRDNNRIDVSGPAFVPNTPLIPMTNSSPGGHFHIIQGEDSAYLLLAGSVVDRDAVSTALRTSGAVIFRSGRYFGEPHGDFVPDWFIRFEKHSSDLVNLLSKAGHVPAASDERGPDLRLRLITAELSEAKARAASLAAELARVRVASAEADAASQAADEATRRALQAERDALVQALAEEAQARAQAEALAREVSDPTPRPKPPRNLAAEVNSIFQALLAGLQPLRDSLEVAAIEYRDRTPLYRALAELNKANGLLPNSWKKVRGLNSWWERHISDGESDAGRIYTRHDVEQRRYEVLISYKSSQSRDIEWLARR